LGLAGTVTPELLRRVGQALYGERWQSALAHALGVSDRRVRQWAASEGQPRPGVIAGMRRLVADRRAELGSVADDLDRLP